MQSTTETLTGWHLKSGDGSWTAAVLPDHFSLETTAYTTWGDFEERFSQLAAAIATGAPPVMEQRVGLRYVDRLVGLNVTDPAGWSRWIAAPILGPPLHAILGGSVIATRQQIDLDLGGGHVCVVRHGSIKADDAPVDVQESYLLDFDIYSAQSRRFEPGAITTLIRAFHQKADSLFRQVITDELLRYLAGEQNV